jgi:hypothetical protein
MKAYKHGDHVVVRLTGPEVEVFWDDIKPSLATTLENSHGEIPESWVLKEVVAGNQQVWAAVNGEKIKAFTITQNLVTAKGVWLDMPFSHSDGDHRVSNAVFNVVKDQAKKDGYIGVKFITSQPRVFKWAKKHGMTERYREFILPFEEVS